jgi:hypothetical protein
LPVEGAGTRPAEAGSRPAASGLMEDAEPESGGGVARRDFGPLVTLAVSVGAPSTRETGARSTVATSGVGECPWGIHATRQAAPATARSGANRKILMVPVLSREDGPILVTKM